MISKKKNGGNCLDDEGQNEFECNCQFPYTGRRCEIDLCANITSFGPCQNDGTCVEDTTANIMAAKCDCPQNYTGDSCQILTEETCARDPPPCQALNVKLLYETFSTLNLHKTSSP